MGMGVIKRVGAGAAAGSSVGGPVGGLVGGAVGLGTAGRDAITNDQRSFDDGATSRPEDDAAFNAAAEASRKPGMNQQEQAAANDATFNAEKAQIEGMGGNAGDIHRGYVSPGSATVGGSRENSDEMAGRGYAGMTQNDAAQKDNSAALANSLANMKNGPTRGPMAPEDSILSGREADARSQQLDSVGLMRDAAMGGAPSAAEGNTRLDMNNNMAAYGAQLGSAHGLSGLNGVQRGASVLGAASGASALTGGMGRSKEIGEAIGMYGTGAGNVAAGDLQRLGVSNQNSNFNADLNDAWTVNNAKLAAQQGNLGAQYGDTDAAWLDEARKPGFKQMGYDQEMREMDRGANSADAARKRAQANDNANRNRAITNQIVTGGLGAVPIVGGMVGGAYQGGMQNSNGYKDY
jgi:hypothetical protein